VPAYPIESDKLLDAADRLAPPATGPGRPPYTAHRRAVSTAYYAVFHAITARIAAVVFPSADDLFRERARRWIGHGDIRTVSRWVTTLHASGPAQLPAVVRPLLAPAGAAAHIDADTVAIADGFLELNDKREQADYDHEAIFARADTRGHIALAAHVVELVAISQTDPVQRYFGLIALQAQIRGR
jgi:hypothetical protein